MENKLVRQTEPPSNPYIRLTRSEFVMSLIVVFVVGGFVALGSSSMTPDQERGIRHIKAAISKVSSAAMTTLETTTQFLAPTAVKVVPKSEECRECHKQTRDRCPIGHSYYFRGCKKWNTLNNCDICDANCHWSNGVPVSDRARAEMACGFEKPKDRMHGFSHVDGLREIRIKSMRRPGRSLNRPFTRLDCPGGRSTPCPALYGDPSPANPQLRRGW